MKEIGKGYAIGAVVLAGLVILIGAPLAGKAIHDALKGNDGLPGTNGTTTVIIVYNNTTVIVVVPPHHDCPKGNETGDGTNGFAFGLVGQGCKKGGQ